MLFRILIYHQTSSKKTSFISVIIGKYPIVDSEQDLNANVLPIYKSDSRLEDIKLSSH